MQHLSTEPHTTSGPSADPAVRGTLAVGLLGIALVHVIDGIGKWTDGPRYEFWLYMGLVAGSLLLAGSLLFTRSRLVFPAIVGLVVPAFVVFILSRTTGLPHSTDDIGNWTEPIGVINLFVEAVVLAIAVPVAALARAGRPAIAASRHGRPTAPLSANG